ncbi:tRNA lysidine(34) synthetase TilS [Schauerella aestuarii]|uniref:tRNA lysidine(34) synthetase TilS n=1 Tax=Schauerella aestuarii TaxID=2511204 RepID=UPI001367D7B7|nr:tRNA lysidine(34) synthetase TilS [Achromobacter aestuarii]MYZ45711.1 tRNA lysidine(34) synthetase TilS [Achromobacter aestuarii]
MSDMVAHSGVLSPVTLDAVRQAFAAHPHARIAIALSGGADSAMLALAAVAVAREAGLSARFVRAFHVHHGLFIEADRWADHVRALCAGLDLPLDVVHVDVARNTGRGIEAAAREARYAAFGQMAAAAGIDTLWMAHHRDDQAETVLLRLLRGSGVAGMGGMAAHTRRSGLTLVRPWLEIDRAVIRACAERFTEATGWAPVDDPSNADAAYTRAAVRTLLAPVLNARWPQWRGILARHARHMREASEMLAEVAAEDLARLEPAPDGASVSLAAWRTLSPARQRQVLRHWLDRMGAPMPTDARLGELVRQLRQLHSLGHDRQLRWQHGAFCIVCVRGRICVEKT